MFLGKDGTVVGSKEQCSKAREQNFWKLLLYINVLIKVFSIVLATKLTVNMVSGKMALGWVISLFQVLLHRIRSFLKRMRSIKK